MLLRATVDGLIAKDELEQRWVGLGPAASRHGDGEAMPEDLLAFLAGGEPVERRARGLLDASRGDELVTADPATSLLPFQPRSIRAFMVWDTHYTASARMMVKRFFPRPVAAIAGGFERVSGKTFPPFKAKPRFYKVPAFYMANHTALLVDGEPMWWP